jgi:hypothetical protein
VTANQHSAVSVDTLQRCKTTAARIVNGKNDRRQKVAAVEHFNAGGQKPGARSNDAVTMMSLPQQIAHCLFERRQHAQHNKLALLQTIVQQRQNKSLEAVCCSKRTSS